MKAFHTFAIGMAVGNIAIGIHNGDAGRVSTFCVLFFCLIFTRRWLND